jgi:prevent-host-death family protein
MSWQLQEAKTKFSELVQKTLDEGPQTVTRHGKEVVVVLSAEDYRKLSARRPSLLEVLMSGPEGELELPPRVVQEREVEW